jgi:hypothetical protein
MAITALDSEAIQLRLLAAGPGDALADDAETKAEILRRFIHRHHPLNP